MLALYLEGNLDCHAASFGVVDCARVMRGESIVAKRLGGGNIGTHAALPHRASSACRKPAERAATIGPPKLFCSHEGSKTCCRSLLLCFSFACGAGSVARRSGAPAWRTGPGSDRGAACARVGRRAAHHCRGAAQRHTVAE